MLKKTRSLQLILDLKCNSNCTICGAAWPFRPQLDTMQAINRLQRGVEMGLYEVVISGGEVTLRHDLIELVQIARSLGYASIVLLTNGRRLANPRYLDSLLQAGITSIGTSLHGHISQVHELVTRVHQSFDQVIAGIKTVRSHLPDIPLSVNCVLSGVNYRFSADVVRLLVRLDVRLIQLTYVVPVGKAKGIYFASDTPRISETLPFLKNGIEAFMNEFHARSDASITLAFYPFCVLRDLISFSGEYSQSMSYFASETGEIILVDDEIFRQNLKIKQPECVRCRFNTICDGVWREYVEAKGWAEFLPITEYSPEQIFDTPIQLRAIPQS